MRKFWFLKGFAIVAAFIFVGGFAVMSLWNWLIPSIFGLATITWLQALGLLVLSKILFVVGFIFNLSVHQRKALFGAG